MLRRIAFKLIIFCAGVYYGAANFSYVQEMIADIQIRYLTSILEPVIELFSKLV